ncbi:hypothetical protein EDD93_5765 [Streptomyces sp. 840.1]|uniref:DUF6215 domain-containing protein n=1 Tax=Streptomyces sp. 840.1 TaxID=2485152 RepID=UPI000F47DE13|nr:DUF6215 domain-containing protein [Streptomyces sp. 840.1]ROQ63031.1 hypothetical protein EDD93_5765 [Streptomyces sp. 840.1]
MLGLILRVLPFWIREPIFILFGSVFGVGLIYAAIRDQEWIPAGLGVAVLLVTAVRIHEVVRVLRARRTLNQPLPAAGEAAGADGTVPQSQAQVLMPAQTQAQQPQPQPQPATVPATPAKEPNAWGQAFAAVGLLGALAAAVWVVPHMTEGGDNTPAPVSCPGEDEKLPKAYARTPKAVTGDELCKALNRPDLAQLVGTPDETATSASGSSGTAALTAGKVAEPEARVQFDTYTVNLSATYNHLSIAQYVKMMRTGGENIRTDTILGRPAVFSSERTMQFEFSLGSKGSTAPAEEGPVARTLSVALDRKDKGGYYDITVWSQSGAFPDDGALLDIAEKVLPTIPDRTAR